MKLALRILIGFGLIVGLAAFFVMRVFVHEVKPGVRQAMENSLVDTANALATLASEDLASGRIDQGRFALALAQLGQRDLSADISGVRKSRFEYRVYVTDARGIVVFDSSGRDVGADYSRWNDVYLTLQGKYGARSTREDPNDDSSSVMYVAAPVLQDGRIIGSLTVARPNRSLQPVIEAGQRSILRQGWWLLGLSFLISLAFAWWLASSLGQLTDYARRVSSGERVVPPDLGRTEIGELGRALGRMRAALDGKQYVEQYVHSLTHEMKSPLAAIRASSELLDEPLPPEQQRTFIANIRTQSQRLTDLVDRMLQLAGMEQRQQLERSVTVDLAALARDALHDAQSKAQQRRVAMRLSEITGDCVVQGDAFLLRQAIDNLIDNALDFSTPDGIIDVSLHRDGNGIELRVRDHGAGIPDFARERVFERFYSLPRPDGARGSGLGLNFVQQIAQLHGGECRVDNHPNGGVQAVLRLPT